MLHRHCCVVSTPALFCTRGNWSRQTAWSSLCRSLLCDSRDPSQSPRQPPKEMRNRWVMGLHNTTNSVIDSTKADNNSGCHECHSVQARRVSQSSSVAAKVNRWLINWCLWILDGSMLKIFVSAQSHGNVQKLCKQAHMQQRPIAVRRHMVSEVFFWTSTPFSSFCFFVVSIFSASVDADASWTH